MFDWASTGYLYLVFASINTKVLILVLNVRKNWYQNSPGSVIYKNRNFFAVIYILLLSGKKKQTCLFVIIFMFLHKLTWSNVFPVVCLVLWTTTNEKYKRKHVTQLWKVFGVKQQLCWAARKCDDSRCNFFSSKMLIYSWELIIY